MKKILFVADTIPPFEFSGIPVVTWKQATELSKRNKVGIIINSIDVKDEIKKSRIENIDIFTIPRVFPNWSSLSYHYKNFSNKELLSEILSQFQPDVLQINGYFNLDVRDFKNILKPNIKVVREVCFFDDICMKGNLINGDLQVCSGPSIEKCTKCYFDSYGHLSENYVKRQIKSITVPWVLKKQVNLAKHMFETVFTGVVFPSESYRNFFGKFIEIQNKSTVVPHGIDLPRNKKQGLLSSDQIIFGFTNTLQFRKGIGLVIDAFKELVSQNIKGFKFFIWGAPTDKKYVQEIMELENKYPELISYKGPYTPEDIPNIAKQVDIALVPSYTEVCPLVVREWLTQGVPCIMTDCFGSEIIKNGYNGFITPTGNASEITIKIKKILDEPMTAANLIKGAGETYIPTIADECKGLESFYENLLPHFAYDKS